MQTTMRTWRDTYLCAEIDGRVVADRREAGPWETWTVESQPDGTIALRSDHGRYLCAELDGAVIADREAIGPWEQWAVEHHGDRVALRSVHGRYLVVEPDGTVRADRDAVGPWELLEAPGLAPAGAAAADPLVGVLRADYDRGTWDDTGERLVVACHAGDLLSRATRNPEVVRGHLDAIAAAGYHGVRTWTVLYGPYWSARTGEVAPGLTREYWSHVASFAAELRARGLRWLVSQGDLMRWAPSTDGRRAFMRELARTLEAAGSLQLVMGVDAGNETAWNGEADARRLADALDAFLDVLHVPMRTLTSPAGEERANDYLQPGLLRDIHSSRSHWPTPARRVFNIGYEQKPEVYTIQSEGPGPGRHVSVMAERDVFLEPETMGVLAACHAIGKALYVYMSSPGVISDEPFDTYPAFRLVPRLFARLPRDVQRWRTFHGGEGRSFSPDRVLAVPDDDRLDVRCDHAARGDQRVCVVYGPPGTYTLRVVRDFVGDLIHPGTLETTPVEWRAGARVPLSFRRGRVLVGRVQ